MHSGRSRKKPQKLTKNKDCIYDSAGNRSIFTVTAGMRHSYPYSRSMMRSEIVFCHRRKGERSHSIWVLY